MISLPKHHALNSLFDDQYSKKVKPHHFLLSNFMSKQYLKIKSSVVDSNNHLNGIFSSFDNLHKELFSSF